MEDMLMLAPWLAFIFLIVWFLITNVIPRVKKYRKKNKQLDEIDMKYESLRKLRKDLIYHIDWAHDRGEHTRAREIEQEMERIENELEELRDRYNEVENGKFDSSKQY